MTTLQRNPDCWVCGEPGHPREHNSLQYICNRHVEGVVYWNYISREERNRLGLWQAATGVTLIDFTEPNAPSSPG